MPEWLVERGIGETRAVLVDDDAIVEARIELDGVLRAGAIVAVRLSETGIDGRNATAIAADGSRYLLPRGAPGISQGASINIEITREAIPGAEPWKLPLARITDKAAAPAGSLGDRLTGRELVFPGAGDALQAAGWDDLLDEARTGTVRFAGGELRISPTPAMTLIDVDGFLPTEELAITGAAQAARAIRRLDIGGSIGIDLPTTAGKSARQSAAAAIDAVLPQPFERTAVNGFGFIQIVRPRCRSSLVELAQNRAAFEARALLRRVALGRPGGKRVVAHPAVITILEQQADWMEALGRQAGGHVGLRPDANLPISAGYAESL